MPGGEGAVFPRRAGRAASSPRVPWSLTVGSAHVSSVQLSTQTLSFREKMCLHNTFVPSLSGIPTPLEPTPTPLSGRGRADSSRKEAASGQVSVPRRCPQGLQAQLLSSETEGGSGPW